MHAMMMVEAFIWYVAGQAGTEHGRGVDPPSFPQEDAGWADARMAAEARRRRRRNIEQAGPEAGLIP